MTNRFEFFKDGDEIYCRDVFDDFNYPMYDEPTAKDIVNYMNYLYDEKKEVSKNFYRFYKEDYCNLEEENEQLKTRLDFCSSVNNETNKQIKLVEKENDELKEEVGKLSILYKAKQKTEDNLIQMGKELEEENEQLKSENEELKKRDNLVLGYLTDEGIITFEKYNEIVDYLYKKWQKRNGDVE